MQRYFIHLQNRDYTPKDAAMLLERVRHLTQDIIVRDSRVSRKYIEFDISISDSTDVKEVIRKFETISPLASVERIVERNLPKHEAIKHAIELFNEEKYWGAHEVLEGVWKTTPKGRERDLINGMILVAAAFVHYLKDEQEICLSILGRAMKKLDGHTGTYYNVDIDRLVELVRNTLQTGRIERFTI